MDQKLEALQDTYKRDVNEVKQEVEVMKAEQQKWSKGLTARTVLLEQEVQDLKLQLASVLQAQTSHSGEKRIGPKKEQPPKETLPTSSKQVTSPVPVAYECEELPSYLSVEANHQCRILEFRNLCW